jgi:predicted Zn-dependent protease
VTQADEPILAGAVLGYGGSTSYWTSASDQAYVTGEVVFDRDLSLVHPGFGAGLSRGNLVQHELGHVVGLDHVQDRAQVMFPSISDKSPDGYGAGDRAGLAQLGAQAGCLRIASPA